MPEEKDFNELIFIREYIKKWLYTTIFNEDTLINIKKNIISVIDKLDTLSIISLVKEYNELYKTYPDKIDSLRLSFNDKLEDVPNFKKFKVILDLAFIKHSNSDIRVIKKDLQIFGKNKSLIIFKEVSKIK
jgi:hypothetical protein